MRLRRPRFSWHARDKLIQPRHPARTVALLFLTAIVVGGILLSLPQSAREEPVGWSTAFFTATSAVCVTGLAVVDTGTVFSAFGQAVILGLIQLGGLGYMAASTFLVLLLGRQPGIHERLLVGEALGTVTLRDAQQLLFRAVRFTLVVELVGAAILTTRFAQEPDRTFGEALWRGVFHSVSAFCNAGFDLFGPDRFPIASLGRYQTDLIVNVTVAALIIIGGLGFVVWEELLRYRSGKPLSLHTRLVVTVTFWLTVAGTLAILVAEWSNPNTLAPLSPGNKLLASVFQSISTRTAGFATLDFGGLRSITLAMMGVLMFIGGSPGGTAGGIKTTTFGVTVIAVWATLRGRPEPEVFERRLPPDLVYRSLVLVFLSLTVLIAGTFILSFTEPLGLQQAGIRTNLFVRIQYEVISALATVGLSTGITGSLSEVGRLVIMFMMFLGRLGPLTAFVALARPPRPVPRRLAEERVPLG
ncbi:MAG: TrkH family potassium uptake protein [Armatimonadota bacterium]